VRLIKAICPDLPIHASTQMTLTSSQTIAAAAELGISRVVLARECSLDEIRRIRSECQRPLEVFVHGALCVAYSGQCLTSEALGGRSANRGECAQACRMPYELFSDGRRVPLGDRRYLLSPQDLAGLEVLPDLIRAGVASLKIEGRLKSPEYVANITRVYRQALEDFRLPISDCEETDWRRFRAARFIQSAIANLKSLRVPVRLRDRAFTFVFEKFVDRCEHDSGATGFDPDIEIDSVFDEMDVAVTDHAEEFAGYFEIVGVDDAVLDRQGGLGRFRDAVTGSGNDRGSQLGERTEDRDGKDVAFGHVRDAVALHGAGVAADTGPLVGAAQFSFCRLVFEIEIGEAGEIDPVEREVRMITLVVLRE
jgi:hypothetical protein